MSRSYEPFEIQIGPLENGQFPLEVRFLGLEHRASIPGDLPLLNPNEIEQARTWLERGFIDRPYAQDFGARLFHTLLPPPIEQFFRQALAKVEPEGGLRILLDQPMPPQLANLTWELLYDPGGLGFLARSVRAPLVRHSTDLPLPHELPKEGPLRVLVVTASPEGKPPIGVESEIESIAATLGKPRYNPLDVLSLAWNQLRRTRSLKGLGRRLSTRKLVEMQVLQGATRAALQNRLLEANDAEQPFHIVHFIGHGEENDDGSFLLLQDGPISAEDFAEIVSEPSVNLAVLNACETAATGLLGSVADACMKRSIPAVIGMQVPVLDRAAIEFAREFYTAWAAGEPIESALAYARRLISQQSPGAAADWSIPILFMGPEKGLQLRLKAPAIEMPWQLKALRWGLAALLSLLGTTALLLQVPDIARGVRTQVPVVRCVFPYPLKSGPSFNVALVDFSLRDESGHAVGGGDGKAVANDLYQRLNASIGELNLPGSHDLGTAPYPCPIQGGTPEERARNAELFAQKVKADVLIYGSIVKKGKFGEIVPEFYVNYTGFSQAAEVVGEHEIGKPMLVNIPISESDLELGQNKALKARDTALINMVVGLAQYSLDNYDQALKSFQAAADEQGWLKSQGKEIVYLLIGNTYGRKAGQIIQLTNDAHQQALAQAEQAYQQALAINPQYARAQVGMAGILYQQALGPLDNTQFDLAKLAEAEQAYRDLLQRSDLPASAHIPGKVHFGLGQVYMARASEALAMEQNGKSANDLLAVGLSPSKDEFAQAANEFQQTIDLYKAGEDALTSIASQSYANMAWIARTNKDYRKAIEYINDAIDIASPYYEARFYAMLGDTYRLSGDKQQAIEAYNTGIGLAERNSDEISIATIEAIKKQIQP